MSVCRLRAALPPREAIPLLEELYDGRSGRYLPTPDADSIDQAILNSQMIVMRSDSERIMAASGIFPLARAKHHDHTKSIQVYELAGMVVSGDVGGLKPYSIQDIMLAIRIVNLAISEPSDLCLISSVVDDNIRSRESLIRMGLNIINEKPPWIDRSRRSWILDEDLVISNLIACENCITISLKCLNYIQNNNLWRTNKQTGMHEEFKVGLEEFDAILETIRDNKAIVCHWESMIPAKRVSSKQPEIDF